MAIENLSVKFLASCKFQDSLIGLNILPIDSDGLLSSFGPRIMVIV